MGTSIQVIGLQTIGLAKVCTFLLTEIDMRSDIPISLPMVLSGVNTQSHTAYVMKEHFQGQWKDNKCHGKGQMDYANGDKYTGSWVEDKKTGQGVYMFDNGNRYEIRCSNIICYYTTCW